MQGTLVNGVAIIAGAILGVLIGKLIPKRLNELTMQIIGLCTLLIGFQLALNSRQVLLVIISMVLGGITGELIRLEERLLALGCWLESRLGNGSAMARSFVYATLLYGVGAMAITGAMESGLLGKHQILYSKSILDGVSSIVLASTMGFGVALAAIPVVIYQGAMALAAQGMGFLLTETVITELSAVGGLLIVAIGLNLLQLKEIKVGNLLPALLFNLLLVSWMG
ncbi:MAG TPA: DUF554 domain-containing protein [Firmicutes bacterium]|nr:DUF554 domain-containing protein [Bacillota bacterium]